MTATVGPPHAVRAAAAAPRRGSPTARSARWLAITALLLYVATGGGRIVGSDEVTMLELGRALLRGGIAVPEGATLAGPDGRFYTKNAPAVAIAALPLIAVGEAAAGAAHLEGSRRDLAVRFVASCFNAIVTALVLAVLYAGARGLGASTTAAAGAAVLLGFTTPLWVYAKSFMAEPLQGLGLLLTVLGTAGVVEPPPRGTRAARIAALGALVAVSAKLSMLPLVLAALAPLIVTPARARVPLAGLVLALAGHALYNAARFGTPFETGYGAQATAAAYTTPLLVGLFGLMLSSGKGVLWFAPAIVLAPAGWRAMRRDGGSAGAGPLVRLGLAHPAGRAAWSILLAALAGLLLYGRFQHWAGDGSYGPRYLVPLLPAAFLAVAAALRRRSRRIAALVLGVLGVIVQIGGVAIYFGAQMREAGDYPYRLPLEDPRSLSDSHFNPAFSPIAGHWRLLHRNLREHLHGEMPRLTGGGDTDTRLGIDPSEQQGLLHALDFWWLYLVYAGFPAIPVAGALAVLLILAGLAARRARAALLAEGRAP